MNALCRSFLRGVFWLILLCGIVIPAHFATAQGTSGTVPDPISARELERYCRRLNLSDQQLQAVQAFHDDYRAEFTVLREGDIEKLLKETRSLQSMGFGALQQQDEVEKALRALNTVMDRIRAVDNRLFDQMHTVLTEEQISQMPRVRQARERTRYQSGLSRMASMMNPAVRIDLSEQIADIDLAPDARQSIEPLVLQYENNLTSAARRLNEASTSMIEEMIERLAELGINEESMRDGRARGQMWTAIRDVWSELNVKLQEKAGAISDLNRRTVKSVSAVLPADAAHKVHDAYYERAYPEALGGTASTFKALSSALKLDDLTDEQRQTINTLSNELRSSLDRLTDQAADLIDENRRTRTFFDFNQDRQREYADKLADLRQKRTNLASAALENLKAALGPDVFDQLNARIAKGDFGEAAVQTAVIAGGPNIATVTLSTVNAEDPNALLPLADPFLPGAITARAADQYAKMLALSRDDTIIYESLFDDYKQRWEEVQKSAIQPVLDASAALWSASGPGGQMTAPSAEAVDKLYDLRKKALQQIMQADAAFFEDIKITLMSESDDDAALQRVRQARLRDVYNRGPGFGDMFASFGQRGPGRGGRSGGPRSFGFFGNSSEESSLDLTVIVDDITLDAEQRSAIEPALREYETAVTEAFRKHYEAAMRLQQSMDKAMARSMQVSADGQSRTAQMGAGFREAMEGDGRASREARRALTDLNRASRDKIASQLPPSAQHEFKQAYNRKAFAWVYRDDQAAAPHLQAAMKLEDLSPQQRSTVIDLSTEYSAAYDELCEKMVQLQAAAPDLSGPPAPGDPRDWQAMQDRQRELEKLTFDRNDLSDKTVSRLKVVLTDEQVQRLGGLSARAE